MGLDNTKIEIKGPGTGILGLIFVVFLGLKLAEVPQSFYQFIICLAQEADYGKVHH